MNKHAALLIEGVYKLLSDEKRWLKNTWSSSYDNTPITPHDKTASKWCIFGALLKTKSILHTSSSDIEDAKDYIHIAIRLLFSYKTYGIIGFNDDPNVKHDDVLNVLRVAHKFALEDNGAYRYAMMEKYSSLNEK